MRSKRRLVYSVITSPSTGVLNLTLSSPPNGPCDESPKPLTSDIPCKRSMQEYDTRRPFSNVKRVLFSHKRTHVNEEVMRPSKKRPRFICEEEDMDFS